ncbi:plasmid mobilization protein [Lentibacter algarum]|uniref:plasmid mobilization protein n=1 Tax=Lentibacter algarum TaxID=576131 RepID=UPI002091E155|nr:plasmid mobilization relaxosome protein MobC [Lentibacter algarum]
MSYADAIDTGPCEGRQASPSNPTGAGKARTNEPLTETFVFRCTAAEKAQLRAKAEAAGLPAATLLREALGLTEARRRKPIPRVDPALVLAVGRIGGNLNQIARWLNRAICLSLPFANKVRVIVEFHVNHVDRTFLTRTFH